MSFRKMTDTLESEYLILDLNEYWRKRELHETEEEGYFSSVQPQLNNEKFRNSSDIYFPIEELTEEQAQKLQTENDLAHINGIKMGLDGEMIAIENELLFSYHMELDSLHTDQIALNLSSPDFLLRPRQQYLLRRLLELKKIKDAKKLPEIENKPPPKGPIRKAIASVLDVGKKLVDVVDDAWSATKGVVPEALVELLNPFFVGITGGIINAAEGFLGARRAYKAYKNKETSEREAKIATGVLASVLGATGTGLAISLVIKGFGIAILGATLIPVFIPACATLIYTAILLRKSYTLHCAKEAEHEAKEAYEQALTKYPNTIRELKETISDLHKKKEALRTEIHPILMKINESTPLTEDENKTYTRYQNLKKVITECDETYHRIHHELDTLKQNYENCREKRLKAERKVAMNVVEVAASVTVLVGIALGASLIFGSAFTFGIPTIIILVGVGIGLACKIFEKVDEKYDHKITGGIRNAFVSVHDYFFSPTKTLNPGPTPSLGSTAKMLKKSGQSKKWSPIPNETTPLLTDYELKETSENKNKELKTWSKGKLPRWPIVTEQTPSLSIQDVPRRFLGLSS